MKGPVLQASGLFGLTLIETYFPLCRVYPYDDLSVGRTDKIMLIRRILCTNFFSLRDTTRDTMMNAEVNVILCEVYEGFDPNI